MKSNELGVQDLFVLDNMLRKHKTLPIVGAHGFLTAAASSPEKRDVDTLLPYLFGGQLPPILEDQKQTLHNLLNALYTSIQAQLREDLENFSPLDFLKKAEEVEQETREQAIRLWCIGYLQGTRLDAEYWKEQHGKEVDQYFYPIILLAGDLQQIATQLGEEADVEAVGAQARSDLLKSVVAIYRITQER